MLIRSWLGERGSFENDIYIIHKEIRELVYSWRLITIWAVVFVNALPVQPCGVWGGGGGGGEGFSFESGSMRCHPQRERSGGIQLARPNIKHCSSFHVYWRWVARTLGLREIACMCRKQPDVVGDLTCTQSQGDLKLERAGVTVEISTSMTSQCGVSWWAYRLQKRLSFTNGLQIVCFVIIENEFNESKNMIDCFKKYSFLGTCLSDFKPFFSWNVHYCKW